MIGAKKIARRTCLKSGGAAPLAASAISALHAEEAGKEPPRQGESGKGRPALVNVPYYSERSDLDAGVACARMVLGCFEPEEHFPYTDVAEMVYHREEI